MFTQVPCLPHSYYYVSPIFIFTLGFFIGFYMNSKDNKKYFS